MGWGTWYEAGTPHFLEEDLCSQDIPPDIYLPHMVRLPLFHDSAPPSILDVASSLYPLL